MARPALRRWQWVLLWIGGLAVAAVAFVVFAFTQTGYGRERARRLALSELAGLVHGKLTIGAVHGNLLGGARIDDVAITDSAGHLFAKADSLILHYSMLPLLRKHLVLHDVTIVHPTVVADQQPGQKWNFERLFASDTSHAPHGPPGFGAWVRIERLTIVDADVTVRRAWTPPNGLTARARDSAIVRALAGGSRDSVVHAPGGYQALSSFQRVDGFFPLVIWSEPGSQVRVVDVGTLRMLARPFRPPPVQVVDLSGHVRIGADTIGFRSMKVSLPGSHLAIDGDYATRSGDVRAAMHAAPAQFEDLHFVFPTLPRGLAIGDLDADQAGAHVRLVGRAMDVHAEGARVQGAIDVDVEPVMRVNSSDLVYSGVDTRVIKRTVPALRVPFDGVLAGHMKLAGTPAAITVDGWTSILERRGGTSRITAGGIVGYDSAGLFANKLRLQFDPLRVSLVRTLGADVPFEGVITGHMLLTGALSNRFSVDADLVHVDSATGRSHILATGEVLTEGGLAGRNLELRFDPLQVALLRTLQPTLPIDGIVTGHATLNGSPKGLLSAILDVVHEGSTGTTRLTGRAAAEYAGALQRIDVDLRAQPLSLPTAGLFLPVLGLQGSATANIVASGSRDDIRFTADVTAAAGGSLSAHGSVALGGTSGPDAARYDIRSLFERFDPSAVSTKGPAAQLNGTIDVAGRGTTLATAVASVDVALSNSRPSDAPRTDSARIVARIDNGLLALDRGYIRLASALAEVDGGFGLVDATTGRLHYVITIDTLSRAVQLARGDTALVYPRPAPQARRFAEARADSVRVARQTEVERAATGRPAEPALKVDSLIPIPRDSVAGAIRAEGSLTGNITRFDAEGNATLRGVLFLASQVQSGDITYRVTNAPGDQMAVDMRARLSDLRVAGFGFDSAHAVLSHAGGRREANGDVDLAIFQDPAHTYHVASGFMLARDREELRLTGLSFRLDSTWWRAAQPALVSWGASGIGLHALDIRGERGGHILADGTLPREGSGDLHVAIDSLQLGDISALLQDTLVTRGILSLDVRAQGTMREPVFKGTILLDSAAHGGTGIPDVRGTFGYAQRQLTTDARFLRGAKELLAAEAAMPVDLALTGLQGSRLLDGPLSVHVRMDSFPLDALPRFTMAVQDVRGNLQGEMAVRGTFKEPALTGSVMLTHGTARLAEPGITLTDATATVRFLDKQVVVDSLVATSGSGPLRASGSLDITQLTRPGFDLQLSAANALVLNGQWGKIRADVAVAIKGPFEAVRVTGNIAVQGGVINAPEQAAARRVSNLDDPTLAIVFDSLDVPRQLRPSGNPLLKHMQMDVGVTVARGTWVRNSAANVEIYTPGGVTPLHVRVDKAGQALTLEGTINADRGEYAVAGRTFKLTTGSATFLGTAVIDPLLQLSAQYEVPRRNSEALTILINVGGYMSRPRITLSSNAQPPMPQSDLISYLAFGRTSASLLSPEGSGLGGGQLGIIAQQQLAGLALGASTDALVRGFEKQGARAGLDVFRIHPGTLPDELAFGGYFQNLLRSTQVEAGKYITPQMFAAVEGRTTLTWPGLRLEYASSSSLSWRATWDPRYLPVSPTLVDVTAATLARQARVLGLFLFWIRRF